MSNCQCTHFDSTELEANYQASKRARLSVPSGPPSLQIPMSPSVSYSPVQDPNELRGVGSHTAGCPSQPIIHFHEHLPDDIELDLDSPTLVNNPRGGLFLSSQAAPTSINQTYNPSYIPQYAAPPDLDLLHTPFPRSYPVSPILSSPASSVGDVEKPLGFLANGTTWECQRGAADPWNFDLTYSGLHKCDARFQSHFSLLVHYKAQHEPFFNERLLSRCGCCGFLHEPYVQSCTKCANEGCGICNASWPLVSWYYGTMMPPTPSLVSGTSTIPTGQGFGNRLLGPPSPFFGSNSCGSSPNLSNSFGSYGGSSYAGSMSNRTFAASPSETDTSRHESIAKPTFTRPPHDVDIPISSPTTKEESHPNPKPPLGDHHHRHLPKMSPSSFTKCTTSPTTFSLIINLAKSLNFLNLPCLALVHYLILLLLLFFPLGSSDGENTKTSASTSFILDAVRAMHMGYYHMPLVSVLCIAVGVAGMWVVQCGGDVVVGQPFEEVAGEGFHERGGMLMVHVLA